MSDYTWQIQRFVYFMGRSFSRRQNSRTNWDFNMLRGRIWLPEDKLNNICQSLLMFITSKKVILRELQSLIASLNFLHLKNVISDKIPFSNHCLGQQLWVHFPGKYILKPLSFPCTASKQLNNVIRKPYIVKHDCDATVTVQKVNPNFQSLVPLITLYAKHKFENISN